MNTFRYQLPESTSPPHSPWDGLSEQAKESLTHIAMGPSAADRLLLPSGAEGRHIPNGAEMLSPEVWCWASLELDNNILGSALGSWQRYEAALGTKVPHYVDEMVQANPNLAPTLTRLYEAKEALTYSGETTPDGHNIGETMKLVVMPWQALSNNQTNFIDWVHSMRVVQGLVQSSDYINSNLLSSIRQNTPLYRDNVHPRLLLTSSEYLFRKIQQDGPWGVMLVQTSNQAGLKSIVDGPEENRSPNALTNSGYDHFKVAGQAVDNMGIYEWLSLTLQEDPVILSSSSYSWLLANKVNENQSTTLPCSHWHNVQVEVKLAWSKNGDSDKGVRLTVA